MVQKSGRARLADLPASGSKYFTKYEADTYQVELNEPKKCKHKFIYIRAQEIGCKKCGMGLYLAVGDYLRNGHLYRGRKLII